MLSNSKEAKVKVEKELYVLKEELRMAREQAQYEKIEA